MVGPDSGAQDHSRADSDAEFASEMGYSAARGSESASTGWDGADPGGGEIYPLKETAAMLNDRLGLYLSPEQQKGFATGLLVGTAMAGAILAWNVTAMLRKGG